ncbi:MAG: efflux RND transporter permease subunit [Candidatus Methanofastidiosia archaeon]
MNPLEKIALYCEKKPYTVILLIIVATALLGAGITRLEMVTDTKVFLSEDIESFKATDIFINEFGGQMYEVILLKGDITSLEGIYAIGDLKERMTSDKRLEGYVLSTTSYIDVLIASGLVPPQIGPQTPQILNQILEADKTSENPMVVGRMISSDFDATIVQINVQTLLDEKEIIAPTKALEEVVRDFSNENEGIVAKLTGDYSMTVEMRNAMSRDNITLLPLAIALVIIILYITFRKISDVIFPFLTILLAIIWILGIMGYAGIPFTALFVSLAPLLLGISIDYTIHMIFRYNEERKKGESVETATRMGLRHTGTAVFLSAATTVFGFSSFGISELPPIRDFGVLAVLGIAFSFVLVTTLLPALTVLRDRNKSFQPKNQMKRDSKILEKILKKLVFISINHKKPILIATLIVTIVSLGVAPSVETIVNQDDLIPDNIESVTALEEIEEIFGKTPASLAILVEGDNLLTIQSLTEIFSLEQQLRQIELINTEEQKFVSSPQSVQSFVDVIMQANNGKMPTSQVQLDTILQMISLNEKTDEALNRLIITDPESPYCKKLGLLSVETNVNTDKDTKIIVKKVNEILSSNDYTLTYRPAGGLPILADILDGLTETQIKTTFLALVLCFIIVSLLFRSIFFGTLAILPVGLTISWEFLILKTIGWSFDLFTIMISAMIVGLGLDFGVHLIHRFREEIKNGEDTESAVSAIIMNVGKALTASTITTAGAFAILGFSMIPMLSKFGLLTALVVTLAFLAAIFVLPPLLAWHNDKKTEE